jgi:hypothetical protein
MIRACPAPGSATSAGAEKRFELFTRNSVEPPLLRAVREAEDAHRRVSNLRSRASTKARRAYQLALRPDVSRLSPATADGLDGSRRMIDARSNQPSTASNISSTIAEPSPATQQKNVSRLCEVQDRILSRIEARLLHRANKSLLGRGQMSITERLAKRELKIG